MLAPHLRSRGRYTPKRIIEFELVPFGVPNFTRAREGVGRKLHRTSDDEAAGVAFDRPHQSGNVGRFDQGAKMLLSFGTERPAQVSGWIPRRPRGSNAISEHRRND